MDNGNPATVEKDSVQFNSQELAQEQKVNTNPVQLNTQNLHIHVTPEKTDYSGKISGITYLGRKNEIVKEAGISLFLGHESITPVYKTNSDGNGNFIIEDLPPGYYTIIARYGEYQSKTQLIKLLPGQNVFQTITL